MDNIKTGYSFDIDTGEFINTEIVYLEKATGTYPHAANVTFKRPPERGEGQAAIFDIKAQDWKLVEDHRGQLWYNPDGSVGGIIDHLGKPEGILTAPPEVKQGAHVEWSGDNWSVKADPGYIIENDEIRMMTQVERIKAGLEDIPDGLKIEGDSLVEKTNDELLADGDISVAEYNERQRQMREFAYKQSTDKLGLMYIRGEIFLEEWQDAIQAVKEQFPYKEDIK